MGCGGSLPKEIDDPTAKSESSYHVGLSMRVGLKEGKTIDDMKALYSNELVVANAIEGCIHFSLMMSEETAKSKTARLTEKYATPADHMALNKGLQEAKLVDTLFATYEFVEMTFMMSQEAYDTPGYKEFLEGLGKACPQPARYIIHDFEGHVNKDVVPAAIKSDHVALTLECGLKAGKTIDDMKKLYVSEVNAVAKKTPGCFHFQLAMSDDARMSFKCILNEFYASPAAHMALNKGLQEADLVGTLFETYDFVNMTFSMSQAQYDYHGYKEFLAGLGEACANPVTFIISDFPSKIRP